MICTTRSRGFVLTRFATRRLVILSGWDSTSSWVYCTSCSLDSRWCRFESRWRMKILWILGKSPSANDVVFSISSWTFPQRLEALFMHQLLVSSSSSGGWRTLRRPLTALRMAVGSHRCKENGWHYLASMLQHQIVHNCESTATVFQLDFWAVLALLGMHELRVHRVRRLLRTILYGNRIPRWGLPH